MNGKCHNMQNTHNNVEKDMYQYAKEFASCVFYVIEYNMWNMWNEMKNNKQNMQNMHDMHDM
jgi:hypothetical protein